MNLPRTLRRSVRLSAATRPRYRAADMRAAEGHIEGGAFRSLKQDQGPLDNSELSVSLTSCARLGVGGAPGRSAPCQRGHEWSQATAGEFGAPRCRNSAVGTPADRCHHRPQVLPSQKARAISSSVSTKWGDSSIRRVLQLAALATRLTTLGHFSFDGRPKGAGLQSLRSTARATGRREIPTR